MFICINLYIYVSGYYYEIPSIGAIRINTQVWFFKTCLKYFFKLGYFFAALNMLSMEKMGENE